MKRNTFLAIVPVLFGACSSGGPVGPGGETHFMQPCDGAENACGEGYECVCGTCTLTCFTDADCGGVPGESRCLDFDRTPEYGSCSVDLWRTPGVCIPTCETDDECGVWGLDYCIDGGCSANAPTDEAVLVPSGPLEGTEGPIGIGTAPVYAAPQGHLFLASPAHLMRSTDGGSTWHEVAGERASALAEVGGVLVAEFATQGLSVSRDNGKTWASAEARGLDGTVFELVSGGGKVYAVAGDRDSGSRNLLFVSGDAAQTWTQLAPLPREESVGALFAGDDVVVATGLFGGGLFRSTDGGATWAAIEAGLAGWATEMTEFRGVLFALAPGRASVFRSADRGLTWSETVLSSVPQSLAGMPFLAATGTELFAAPGDGSVYRLDEGPMKWVDAAAQLPAGRITAFAGSDKAVWIAADELLYRWSRTDSRWMQVDLKLVETNVVALAEEGGILVAASGSDAVHLSGDFGATWLRGGEGIPNDARVVQLGVWAGRYYASTEAHGIFASNDGLVWLPASKGVPMLPGESRRAVVSAFAFDSDTTWAATTDRAGDGKLGVGVLRTADGGESWEIVSDGLPGEEGARESIRSLLYVDGILYAGTARSGVYTSGDRGATWMRASSGLPEIGGSVGTVTGLVPMRVGIAATVSQPDAAGTALFWSGDQGANWAPLGEKIAFPGEVRSVASRSGLIAASVLLPDGSGALYASTDRGVTWKVASEGVVPGPVVVGHNAIFVGTAQAGVWRLGLEVRIDVPAGEQALVR